MKSKSLRWKYATKKLTLSTKGYSNCTWSRRSSEEEFALKYFPRIKRLFTFIDLTLLEDRRIFSTSFWSNWYFYLVYHIIFFRIAVIWIFIATGSVGVVANRNHSHPSHDMIIHSILNSISIGSDLHTRLFPLTCHNCYLLQYSD